MKHKSGPNLYLVLSVFLAVVLVLAIVYAAFTKQLSLSGVGTVNDSTWKIKFDNLQSPVLAGDAEQVTAPSLSNNDTKLSNYSVNLYGNGDSITYTFDVVNDGDFDAKITSINIPTPTCTKTIAGVNQDASLVCSNLSYTLKYSNGTSVALNDTLNAGVTKTLKLSLSYSSQSEPMADVEISNLGISITYTQV